MKKNPFLHLSSQRYRQSLALRERFADRMRPSSKSEKDEKPKEVSVGGVVFVNSISELVGGKGAENER